MFKLVFIEGFSVWYIATDKHKFTYITFLL